MSQLNLIHKKYKDIHRLKTTYANDFSIGNHIIIQEKIDGANAPVYVEALKEAAALLWLFCYNGQMKEPLDIKINDSVL